MTTPTADQPYSPPNPWVWESADFAGKLIRISITYGALTRLFLSATAYRDADCMFQRLYLGIGPDGRPDSTPDAILVPAGTTSIMTQLRKNSLRTIEDVVARQITAGP